MSKSGNSACQHAPRWAKLNFPALNYRSITSFGDRHNTYDEVSEYFKAHFVQVWLMVPNDVRNTYSELKLLQVHRRKDNWQRALYAVCLNQPPDSRCISLTHWHIAFYFYDCQWRLIVSIIFPANRSIKDIKATQSIIGNGAWLQPCHSYLTCRLT